MLRDRDELIYNAPDETFTVYFESTGDDCTEQCPKCGCWLIQEINPTCPVCGFYGESPDYELYPTKPSEAEDG